MRIIEGQPLSSGWSGKLWAINQGIQWAQKNVETDYFLLTDADINHASDNLSLLLAKAQKRSRSCRVG